MIALAITIIIGLVVIAIVGWIARSVVRHMGGPDFIWQVIVAVFVLLLLAYLLAGERVAIGR